MKAKQKYGRIGNPMLTRTVVLPKINADHNFTSWEKLCRFIKDAPDKKASLEDLANAVGVHRPPASQRSSSMEQDCRHFVLYCVDQGWLRVVA